jgi:hypothetical protein
MIYDFAYSVLFNGADNALNYQTRDPIFYSVLNSLDKKPVKIFQIGAIETFNINWRVGSGWSDIIFGQYIKKYGGKLTIADINLDNIAHSYLAASKIGYEVELLYGDAINFITKEDYDIYYLDGSNDPQETLDQFNKVKDKKCIILVDDFSIKGTLLQDKGFNIINVANQVGVLDLRNVNL